LPVANVKPAGPLAHVAVAGYELLEEIGRGAMGVVYKARQVRLNRAVALKMILSAEYAGPQELARFKAEAEAVARLQHPNIVQIFEVGEADGRPYFTLEYVDGVSLDKALDGTPQPPPQAARLVETLARAVHHAHEHGVIHRDLKPANILLSRVEDRGPLVPSILDPRSSVPKVVDFGLAKTLSGSQGPTQSGAVLGTPSYMAPEQAQGKGKEVGPAADVYALGAILYELLTGRPPFLAATPLDTILQVVADEPVPPARLQPKLPRDLDTVCLKCLQKDPTRRYASAADLAEDLRRFQAREPILARPAGVGERLGKWARRRPAVAALSAAVVLVTAAAFALVTAALLHADDQRRQAEGRGKLLAEANDYLVRVQQQLTAAELEARDQAEQARESAYFSDVALAQQLWRGNDVAAARRALLRCPEDLRRWEWHYLLRQCGVARASCEVPAPVVAGLRVSPDGRRLALTDLLNRLRFYDAEGLSELPQPPPPPGGGAPHEPAFSPDGRQLARVARQGVALLDAESGRVEREVVLPGFRPLAVAYTGSRLLAAGFREVGSYEFHTLEVWDVLEGRKTASLPGFQGPRDAGLHVSQVVLGLEGKLVAALAVEAGVRRLQGGALRELRRGRPSGHSQLKVWNVQAGNAALPRRFAVPDDGFAQVAVSRDGRLAYADGALVHEGSLAEDGLQILRGHQKDVHGLAYSPDGKTLATGSADRSVKLWDVEAGVERFTLRGHDDPVLRVAFSPDGRRLYSADGHPLARAATVKAWDVTADPEASTATAAAEGTSQCLAVSPDGRRYLQVLVPSAGARPVFSVHEAATGRAVCVPEALRGEREATPAARFSPDGLRLAVFFRQAVQLADAVTGKSLGRLAVRDWLLQGGLVAFSPDGRRLAAAWALGQSAPGPPRGRRPAPRVGVQCWEAETGKPLWKGDRELSAPPGAPPLLPGAALAAVTGLAFSPDGGRIAVGVTSLGGGPGDRTARGEAQVWDAARGVCLAAHPHDGLVCAVAYDAGGRRLAVAGGPPNAGRVSVWDCETGREAVALRGHNQPVTAVAFDPDGARLVTAGGDLLVKLWDPRGGREVLTLGGHRRGVTEVLFCGGGRRLVSATGASLLDTFLRGPGGPGDARLPAEVKVWDSAAPE
jgi:WD40 repeat protein/tRNA A-37 threonylcarbamoyl transferase component Bud32